MMNDIALNSDVYKTIFQTVTQGILVVDEFGIILKANPASEKMFGYDKNELEGLTIEQLIPQKLRVKHKDLRKSYIANPKTRSMGIGLDLHGVKKNGGLFPIDVSLSPMRWNNKPTAIAFTIDTSELKKKELLKNSIQLSLEMITLHKPLKSICDQICSIFDSNVSDCKSAILILDPKQNLLYNLSGSKLPSEVNKTIDGITIRDKNGCTCACSRTALSKKETILTNLKEDYSCKAFEKPRFDDNILATWSYPILATTNDLLGVFATYCTNERKPSIKEKALINDLIRLISIAIEQFNTNNELKANREKLQNYSSQLEAKVKDRTQEVAGTVQKLVESNLKLEDQMALAKIARNEAIAHQALLNAIGSNFPKGIMVVVNTNHTIVFAEGEDLETIGFKKNELLGLKIDDLQVFSQSQLLKIQENVENTLKGQHLSFQTNYKHKTYSVNSTPLFNEDIIIAALFVYTDISSQKEVELEIIEALKKEQELSELKSRFISMASHEFRTPLSAILSSADLLEKLRELGLDEGRVKYLKRIKSNVKTLMSILNDFLSLSKLEEGKIIVKPEKIEIVSFITELTGEIATMKKEGQTIKIDKEVDQLDVVIDKKLLRNIFINLLSNAIKYSSTGTEIQIGISHEGSNLLLKVTDQGIGIPEKEQLNLFKRFFRAGNAGNTQGTGLGLFLVKNYVTILEGKISFSSKLNVGSSFIVELPINQKHHEKNTDN
ncbi:PAS domain S-box protein [Spongiivirga citrea]|uniref:histidine kinase n=1 Tax=Spongiivirga citrea TaxID=1481457 RepID=A0A6M0CIH0_9FLAO|nr:PAS domain S-box protein [Spongiivirga citrea]NER15729.1 PAS domain S-box protein [Spongiivirga citrea]